MNKDLKLEPHRIRGCKDAWWYEEDVGLSVVMEPSAQIKTITIPWASLRGALKRLDRKS